MRSPRASLPTALAVFLLCRAAAAQQPSPPSENALATRRLLIADAQRASESGDHARALDLALQASRVQMTPSLRYFIASEQQATGHLSAAYAAAELCQREMDTEPNAGLRRELTNRCRAIATALLPRLARVTVRLAQPVAGARVTVNGTALTADLLGVPYAVDPGRVRVEATAPGHQPFTGEVQVNEGASGELAVTLTPAPAAPPVVQETPVAPPPPPPPGVGPAPFIVLALGGAVAVGGAVMLGLGASAAGQVRSLCPDFTCPTVDVMNAVQPTFNSMRTYNIVGGVMLPVGVLAAVGGVGWYLSAQRARPTVASTLQLVPTGSGVLLLGRF